MIILSAGGGGVPGEVGHINIMLHLDIDQWNHSHENAALAQSASPTNCSAQQWTMSVHLISSWSLTFPKVAQMLCFPNYCLFFIFTTINTNVQPCLMCWCKFSDERLALDRGRTLSISYFYVILEQIITNICSKQEAAAKWKICSSMSSE